MDYLSLFDNNWEELKEITMIVFINMPINIHTFFVHLINVERNKKRVGTAWLIINFWNTIFCF